MNFDVCAKTAFGDFYNSIQNLMNVNGVTLKARVLRKCIHFIDQLTNPVGLLDNQPCKLAVLNRNALFEQLCRTAHAREGFLTSWAIIAAMPRSDRAESLCVNAPPRRPAEACSWKLSTRCPGELPSGAQSTVTLRVGSRGVDILKSNSRIALSVSWFSDQRKYGLSSVTKSGSALRRSVDKPVWKNCSADGFANTIIDLINNQNCHLVRIPEHFVMEVLPSCSFFPFLCISADRMEYGVRVLIF